VGLFKQVDRFSSRVSESLIRKTLSIETGSTQSGASFFCPYHARKRVTIVDGCKFLP
jgi:hypothetical protein